MSIKVMSQVWELDLPSNRKFVLLALADHANDEGGDVFPSVERIAWKCRYSERQVQRIMRGLEEGGLLVRVSEGTGGRGQTTRYRIDVEKGVKMSPFIPASERVTSATERVTSATERVTPMSPEPSVEPSVETNPLAGASTGHGVSSPLVNLADARVERQLQDSVDFEAGLWDVYPRHPETQAKGGGGSKRKTLAAWKAMTAEQRARALTAVGNYAVLMATPNPVDGSPRRPKYAENWLTDEMWEAHMHPPTPVRAAPRHTEVVPDYHGVDF